MRNLARLAGGVVTRVGAAALVLAVVAAPALAAGPKLATPNQKTLIETEHFGTFYLPKIVVAGKAIVATWRGPGQNDTVRTIAVSKDNGANFTYKLKPVRIPAMAQIIDVAGDTAGNVYFVGTTLIPSQLVIVHTTPKFKEFSAPTFFNAAESVVNASLATSTDGKLYLAYQTSFSVRIRNNSSAPADQVQWAISGDAGATFSDFVATNAKPTDFSDLGPKLVTGPNGAVYLLSRRDDTALRAPSPTEYAGGTIAITRLDQPEPTTVTVTRPSAGSGRVDQVEGYVAGDGTLGVAWSDRTLGATATVQTVRLMRVDPATGAQIATATDLASVGSAGDFHLGRSGAGEVTVIMIGAGYDSDQPEPAIIGRASTDDGATFGPIRQVTGYPSVTSLDVTSDGQHVYGLWTDTRMVRFSGFTAKASKN